jgi:hypothetical protein
VTFADPPFPEQPWAAESRPEWFAGDDSHRSPFERETIAVVVVTYHSERLLPELLASLPRGLAGLRWHLTVADNAVTAVFLHAGQVCSAGAGLIVEDSAGGRIRVTGRGSWKFRDAHTIGHGEPAFLAETLRPQRAQCDLRPARPVYLRSGV